MESRGGSKPRGGCRIGSGSLGEIYVGGVQANEEPAVRLRVKVYRLSPDEKWDDQGTGHVTVDYLERTEDLALIVIGEEDNETLLVHRISADDIYRRQEDTIISWRDPELATDWALSFQEAAGCSYIWDRVCGVQRNLQFNTIGNDAFHSASRELRELPSVELSTLPLILKTVVDCGNGIAEQMHVADLVVQDHEFIPKLVDLFRMCEDLENIDSLHIIFKIVKAIILLNSPQIFDRIFADEFILDIIGALEYDPDVPQPQKHRSFLKEHVVFKEVIPIKDPQVLSRIHQSYRISYIKDAILPRVLDEGTMASLNSIIHGNNTVVISMLKDDTSFIQQLFLRMRSSGTSMESKRNLVLFLQEFCSLSKSLQLAQQLRLFRELANEEIFEILTDVLQSPDKKLVLTGTDILILFVNQDANLLRNFVVHQEDNVLLGLLVKGMITDFGDNMNCQFLEILRILLESYTTSSAQSDAIIDIFYEKYLDELVDVVTRSFPSVKKSAQMLWTKPEILSNICELLCFCVLHHPYRIKCNFIINNVIEKVLCLTRRREKYLVVAAVRFMRTVVSRNDEFLARHIAKNNLMRPIVEAFVRNGSRYNMLQSAVLELLERIIDENKTLTAYVYEGFWEELSKFQHFATIDRLRKRYEQSLERYNDITAVAAEDLRKRIDERALEKEEEEYFNEQSDGEDSSDVGVVEEPQRPLANGTGVDHGSPLRPSGLVDYEDDDEDEDEDSSHETRRPMSASAAPKRALTLAVGKERERGNRAKRPRLDRREEEAEEGDGEEEEEDEEGSACSTSKSATEDLPLHLESGDNSCQVERESCPSTASSSASGGGATVDVRQPIAGSSASADVAYPVR